ncbi:MAG: YbgC/FadM family acyl-CoA thioesterase, partial [Nitrospirae bacterium]
PICIYYEDTDCGGVVYYANYLKYFERARTDYLEQRGVSVAQLMNEGTVFMVVRAEVEYKAPARYGETLAIETDVDTSKNASVTFSHIVKEKTSGRLVVEGSATLVTTDLSGKLKRMDQALKQMLQAKPSERSKKEHHA